MGNFIFVMREGEVFTSQVKIKAGSQYLHAHGTAFNVPTGPSVAPWAGPVHFAIFIDAGFPEGKVTD